MKRSFQKYLWAAVTACALVFTPHTSAITIGADRLLGSIDPAQPASTANQTEQVSFLVDGYNDGNPSGTDLGDNPDDPNTETYTLLFSDPTEIPAPPNAPGATAPNKIDNSDREIDLGTDNPYAWVLGKYGPDAEVYYIGDLTGGQHTLPERGLSNDLGLSHHTLFEPLTQSVPEGGTTAALFGLAVLGLAGFRRFARS